MSCIFSVVCFNCDLPRTTEENWLYANKITISHSPINIPNLFCSPFSLHSPLPPVPLLFPNFSPLSSSPSLPLSLFCMSTCLILSSGHVSRSFLTTERNQIIIVEFILVKRLWYKMKLKSAVSFCPQHNKTTCLVLQTNTDVHCLSK